MFLTIKETGEKLRKSRWTIKKLIDSGELEAVKGPTAKAHIHVVAASVERYIARHLITPAAEGEQ